MTAACLCFVAGISKLAMTSISMRASFGSRATAHGRPRRRGPVDGGK